MKRFNSIIRGIFKVSSANIVALVLSVLTSFVLPIFISVEQYGYWQLFVLYVGYTGFFMFGFNDGVHLNYASYDYDEELASKFKTFGIFLSFLIIIESIVLVVILLFLSKQKDNIFFILLLCIVNIFPQVIVGLFTYMNQSTLRFSQYAMGHIFDKIVFAILMVILITFGVRNALFYVLAYTISRYLLIGYHWYSSKLVFVTEAFSIKQLKGEIVRNFKSGFPLMIATILNGSIIVGSRLLVQAKFGIESFSTYSFSIHTIVVATQFFSAIATVFYPIMKRNEADTLQKMYVSFDKIATIVSALLLPSYFIVVLVIQLIYTEYVIVLDYLYWVYPLFIFHCKSNLLVTNFYKVKNKPNILIVRNAAAIAIHLFFAFSAYYFFRTVEAIAASVLISYCIWYYMCQIYIYHTEKWELRSSVFYDAALVGAFTVIVVLINQLDKNTYIGTSYGCLSFTILCILVYFIKREKINASVHEFSNLLHK